MIKKMKILIIVIPGMILLTSCFSTYPIQKKFPCQETTTSEKLEMIENALRFKIKPKKMELNENGISYTTSTFNKSSFNFSDVEMVRFKTKSRFLKKRGYWIDIKESNGDVNVIYSTDFKLMESANNALMCLTNLQETNGRPIKSSSDKEKSSNKYDDLEKLKKLLDSGAITKEEYEFEKEKILNK